MTAKKKTTVKADGGGSRYNEGKNKLSLIPPEWIWGLGMLLTRGAMKYEIRNWERGMSWSAVLDSGLRHIMKFVAGERYDEETGCHHMVAAAWNMLVLMTYDIRDIGDMDLVGEPQWLEQTAIEPSQVFKDVVAKKHGS